MNPSTPTFRLFDKVVKNKKSDDEYDFKLEILTFSVDDGKLASRENKLVPIDEDEDDDERPTTRAQKIRLCQIKNNREWKRAHKARQKIGRTGQFTGRRKDFYDLVIDRFKEWYLSYDLEPPKQEEQTAPLTGVIDQDSLIDRFKNTCQEYRLAKHKTIPRETLFEIWRKVDSTFDGDLVSFKPKNKDYQRARTCASVAGYSRKLRVADRSQS